MPATRLQLVQEGNTVYKALEGQQSLGRVVRPEEMADICQ